MPQAFKQLLEKLMSEKAPGPFPTFSIFHLLRAIELMAEKTMGRGKLAENLNVGEGAIRTILNRLKEAKLVSSSKAGCTLTNEGMKLWKDYKSIFKRKVIIERNELAPANYNFAILIKAHGRKVKSGMEQRDAAVMAGAKTATTLVLKRDA